MDTRNSILAQALAFVQGITWMRACADELVGLFQAAGRAAGVRESLLGATVMAWGASAGDLGGMLALARAGYARMAIAASLAGPVCQLSIGTGFSMLLVRFEERRRGRISPITCAFSRCTASRRQSRSR